MHRNTEPSPRYHEEKSIVDQSVIGLRNKQNPRFFLFIYTTCGLDHHSRLEYVIQEKSRDYRRHMYIHTHPWLSDGKKTRQSVGITNKTLPCMLLPERAIYRTRFECTRVYIPMILHVPAVIWYFFDNNESRLNTWYRHFNKETPHSTVEYRYFRSVGIPYRGADVDHNALSRHVSVLCGYICRVCTLQEVLY